MQYIANICNFTDINLKGVAFMVSIQVPIWQQTIWKEREENKFGEGQEFVS